MRPGRARCDGCPSRIRTSVHGSKVRCPTTRRRGSGSFLESSPGAPRARKWSGRRDSNPRPSPWQGDALPTEPLPLESPTTGYGGAESQNRTGDTAIFSRVLYQLSYLGPMANQALVTRRRTAGYHGPRRPFNDVGSARPAPARRVIRYRTSRMITSVSAIDPISESEIGLAGAARVSSRDVRNRTIHRSMGGRGTREAFVTEPGAGSAVGPDGRRRSPRSASRAASPWSPASSR